MQCGHPHTGDWYVVGNNPVRLAKWSVATNAWTMAASDIIPGASYDPQRGMPAIDPRGAGLMLVIGGTIGHPDPTGYNFVWVYDLATLSVQQGSLTGPYASRVTAGYWWAGGLVFDEGINKFVHCPDDGYLYTLERVGTTDAVLRGPDGADRHRVPRAEFFQRLQTQRHGPTSGGGCGMSPT